MCDPIWWMWCIVLFICIFFDLSHGREVEIQVETRKRDYLAIRYEKHLADIADSMIKIYPDIQKELEKNFDWPVDFSPTIILIKNSDTFKKISENGNIAAFAQPAQNLIVIDCSKIGVRPLSQENILKHELCHLLLHRHIANDSLPKWFDEGVCQWATGGIGEILQDRKPSLNNAIISRKLIRLNDLWDRFPADKSSMELAYEESRSVIEFIGNTFGTGKLLEILNYLKTGETFEVAFKKTLSMTPSELENQWHASFGFYISWILFIAQHFYEIIFFAMALAAVIAFIKITLKRRREEHNINQLL